jgi:hypothetical protein
VDINYIPPQVEIIYINSGGSSGGSTSPTVAAIVAGIMAQAAITPIYADTRKMNGAAVAGSGTEQDKWRGGV